MNEKRFLLDVQERIQLKTIFGTLGWGDGQFNFPCGVCAIEDKIMVCDSNNNRIQIFNQKGQFISSIIDCNGELFRDPYGICVSGKDILVANNRSHKIYILNPKLSYSIDVGTLYPKRIFRMDKDQILVTVDGGRIVSIDQNSGMLKQFAQDYSISPSGICCNSTGKVLVAYSHSNGIAVFDKHGNVLHTFDSTGGNPNQFKFPRGICVDRDDNIFVADYLNDRICVFNSNFQPLQQISFESPSDLCITSTQLVVTSCTRNCVGIFSN